MGPWSIPNVTERHLLGEVREAFASTGVKQLPLSGEQYEKWLKTTDEKVAKSIDAKLHYLQVDYGYDSTLDLLGKDAIVGTTDRIEVQGDIVGTKEMHYYNSKDNDIEMVEQQGNRLVFDVASKTGDEVTKYRFQVALNQFVERDIDRNHHSSVEPLILDNGEAAFVVSYFSLSVRDNSVMYPSVSGILFTK